MTLEKLLDLFNKELILASLSSTKKWQKLFYLELVCAKTKLRIISEYIRKDLGSFVNDLKELKLAL